MPFSCFSLQLIITSGINETFCLVSKIQSFRSKHFYSPASLHLQVLSLLQFLVVENQQKLKEAISRLEPFPNLPEFREMRSVQHTLKYNGGTFTLRQVKIQVRCVPTELLASRSRQA